MAESNHTSNNNYNSNKSNDASASASPSAMAIDGSEQDSVLSNAEFLTREEVLRRRSRRVKQLARCYKHHYWALMEELRIKYREYYWKYGKSPYKEDEKREEVGGAGGRNCTERAGENHNKKLGLGLGDNVNRCAVAGCKAKAMALTRFCHPHILSDSKQKLYKGCAYVIKSAQTGSVLCGKPILRSTVPSLCPSHFQKAEKHVTRALKKAGLNVSSSSKLAPKLHVVVAEYVRQIQTKRRAAQRAIVDKVQIKEENTS